MKKRYGRILFLVLFFLVSCKSDIYNKELLSYSSVNSKIIEEKDYFLIVSSLYCHSCIKEMISDIKNLGMNDKFILVVIGHSQNEIQNFVNELPVGNNYFMETDNVADLIFPILYYKSGKKLKKITISKKWELDEIIPH
ncbi:MAG: hypothetical protein ACOCWG_04205 [bacterium]